MKIPGGVVNPRSAQHKIALMLHTRYWSISISRGDCITLQIRCRRTGQFKLWLLKCRWTATDFGNDAENFNYRVIRWTNLGRRHDECVAPVIQDAFITEAERLDWST